MDFSSFLCEWVSVYHSLKSIYDEMVTITPRDDTYVVIIILLIGKLQAHISPLSCHSLSVSTLSLAHASRGENIAINQIGAMKSKIVIASPFF